MRNHFMTMTAAPLLVVGYREPIKGFTYTRGNDAEVVAAAFLGGDDTFEHEAIGVAGATGEIEAYMNGKIAETISLKVGEQLNQLLDTRELNVDELESASMQGKDVNVGFNWNRRFFVELADERIPFANGETILNGGVNLTMKYLGGGKFTLIASGDFNAELDGIEREGSVRDIPYALSLDGSNTLGVYGSFGVTIKRWKVHTMSATLTATVVDSNVVATGEIADRSVTATVDTMDLSLKIGNNDILGHPKAFGVTCSGNISMRLNDDTIASCAIASSYTACK